MSAQAGRFGPWSRIGPSWRTPPVIARAQGSSKSFAGFARNPWAEPAIVGTGYNTGGDDIGSSYVEVDMTNQTMFIYIDGQQALSTPIVTGAIGSNTIPGAYSVWNKEENAILRGTRVQSGTDYEQPVSFWLPFDDTGQGIHDANWQSSFGGEAYLYSGSQGCINTPPDVMPRVFELVSLGMPVIVFQ